MTQSPNNNAFLLRFSRTFTENFFLLFIFVVADVAPAEMIEMRSADQPVTPPLAEDPTIKSLEVVILRKLLSISLSHTLFFRLAFRPSRTCCCKINKMPTLPRPARRRTPPKPLLMYERNKHCTLLK